MEKSQINFKIVTPERTVYSATIAKVSLPTAVGQITVLPNHESLIGIVEPGEIILEEAGGNKRFLAVSEGFVEIENNNTKIFAQAAEKAEEMDEAAIMAAKEEAEKALEAQKNSSRVQMTEAESRLKRELIKLRVLKKYKGHN